LSPAQHVRPGQDDRTHPRQRCDRRPCFSHPACDARAPRPPFAIDRASPPPAQSSHLLRAALLSRRGPGQLIHILRSIGLGQIGFFLVASAALAFLALAIFRVWLFRPAGAADPGFCPPLTILKPLCGAEAGLPDRLRTICRQSYPEFQIVFGVASAADAALAVVHRLRAEFPDRDIAVVVNDAQHGANRKVSNLINMVPVAKHGILLVCDSDVGLPEDCLGAFIAPLADPAVGAVTATYRGVPTPRLASQIGALLLNDWFFPGTLIAEAFGPIEFCNGPLSAIRRTSLEAVGGFEALADQLADDVALGALIASRGERVVLSRVLIDIVVDEDFRSLIRRELRWARTIRATQPVGHFWSPVTHVLPLLLPDLILDPGYATLSLVLAVAALRLVLDRIICARLAISRPPPHWLLLVREVACLSVWIWSYAGRSVEWRGATLAVAQGGGVTNRQSAERGVSAGPLTAPAEGAGRS
jgi:ceramide glucosyltransferase